MTLPDARKILGLDADEDPFPHLAEFRVAREHIAALVRSAPNETLSMRYQKGLVEFDQALAAVYEHLESASLTPPPLPPKATEGPEEPQTIEKKAAFFKSATPAPVAAVPVEPSPAVTFPDEPLSPPPIEPSPTVATSLPAPAKTVVLGLAPAAPKIAASELAKPEIEKKKHTAGLAWLLFVVCLVGGAGGAWLYQKDDQAKKEQRMIRIAFLDRQGSVLIENRRWQEASQTFAEIDELSPGSELALRGYRSIEAGKGEEQTQFIGYWTGQATAELEAGRLDEATAAARQVLDKYPNEKDAADVLDKVSAARVGQSRVVAIESARKALDQRQWDSAISTVKAILAKSPDDVDAKSILADAVAASQKAKADQVRALELLKMASARDSGQFDQQALDWLREAASLAPENKEITGRLEKLLSYTRTLHVPGDFATPEEALANAHDRDRIVLGAGTWKGPLVVDAAVEIQGAGFAETKIECVPADGSAITVGPDAKGARITGITFRHESFAVGSDRFSAALVRGGGATFVDCRFTEASGHGLAVIEGGEAVVSRSRFADNGWDGVAAIGQGSTIEIRDCEALNNFEHGIESWNGAAVILVNNRCEGNSRNGIHADNGLASATIEGNQLISNREFGLVLDSAAGGRVTGNTARANLLGGFVIRSAASKLAVTTNQSTLNQGPGLIFEKGLNPAAYSTNTATQNTGEQILAADLTADAPVIPDVSPATPVAAAPAEAKIPRAAIVPVAPTTKKRR